MKIELLRTGISGPNLLYHHFKSLNKRGQPRIRSHNKLGSSWAHRFRQAPQEKPNDCIWVIMEIFNSLGVFVKGTKINSLNKLCRQFNTDILAGRKTQTDWHQDTDKQQFRNLIGVGMENRSMVAYNINEWIQHN